MKSLLNSERDTLNLENMGLNKSLASEIASLGKLETTLGTMVKGIDDTFGKLNKNFGKLLPLY